MILGWSGEDFKKTQGKIFTGSSGRNIYSYALASPEWFSQFVAGGTHMSGAWADKSAYARRDYNAAKKNLEQYFERRSNATEEDIQAQKAYPNMEEGEKVQLRVFFEKYWKEFCGPGSAPKVALIDRSAFNTREQYEQHYQWDDFRMKSYTHNRSTADVLLFFISHAFDGIDDETEKSIPPNKISIAQLPEIHRVYPSS